MCGVRRAAWAALGCFVALFVEAHAAGRFGLDLASIDQAEFAGLGFAEGIFVNHFAPIPYCGLASNNLGNISRGEWAVFIKGGLEAAGGQCACVDFETFATIEGSSRGIVIKPHIEGCSDFISRCLAAVFDDRSYFDGPWPKICNLRVIYINVGSELLLGGTFGKLSLIFTGVPEFVRGLPQGPCEPSYRDGGEGRDRHAEQIQKRLDFERYIYGKAVGGAFFMACIIGFLTYLAIERDKGKESN